MPWVRPKSSPVPNGRSAISAPVPATPFTTSFTVPSPPTTTSSESRASRATSARCPGNSDKTSSPRRPSAAACSRSLGQRLPVAPLPAAGLTRKRIPLIVGDGHQRDARHAIDRSAQLVVGDPLEDALDDDVRHGEETSAVDALHPADSAESRDREERRRLHLDPQNAAARPPRVLAVVR